MEKPKDFEILDNMAEIVMIENEVGILKYVNKAFCRCHGVSAEEAIGRSCFDFIIPEDREACNMEQVVSSENPYYRIEGRSKRVDGTIIWLQYVGRAYFDNNGKLLEFQEIGVDITKWKEKIEESAKELAKKTNKWIGDIGPDIHEQEKTLKMDSHNGKFPATAPILRYLYIKRKDENTGRLCKSSCGRECDDFNRRRERHGKGTVCPGDS